MSLESYQRTRKAIKTGGEFHINARSSKGGGLVNFNILQYVSRKGDVQAFEDVVSLGAAIDMPALEEKNVIKDTINLPRSSALALYCMTLAFNVNAKAMYGDDAVRDPSIPRILEIAVRRVRLGADIHDVLEEPSTTYDDQGMMQCVGALGLFGKTAFELAKMSHNKRLVQTMKRFCELESVTDEVECRCGSRLPWVECCHAGDGTTPVCREVTGDTLLWQAARVKINPNNTTTVVGTLPELGFRTILLRHSAAVIFA